MGINNNTLTKYYSDELEKGRIEANAAVAGTLYEKAKQGDTSSMIFWLKTRAQWSEKNTTELTGEGGAPINIKVITGID
jgi:DNA transposition AAA+ family ATPase